MRCYLPLSLPLSLMLASSTSPAADLQEETEIKFAIYSSAWGENTDDGLRVIAYNQTSNQVRLDSVTFLKSEEEADPITLEFNVEIPATGYGGVEMEYVDLLQGDECLSRTMEENWKLVEVSNYTLNPSVRNLIIEDTDSFRIYQCVESVATSWTDLGTGQQHQYEEWVLFHFETRQDL